MECWRTRNLIQSWRFSLSLGVSVFSNVYSFFWACRKETREKDSENSYNLSNSTLFFVREKKFDKNENRFKRCDKFKWIPKALISLYLCLIPFSSFSPALPMTFSSSFLHVLHPPHQLTQRTPKHRELKLENSLEKNFSSFQVSRRKAVKRGSNPFAYRTSPLSLWSEFHVVVHFTHRQP